MIIMDNYLEQCRIWQEANNISIQICKNSIDFYKKDIELTTKKLQLEEETLRLMLEQEENIKSDVEEYKLIRPRE